VFSVNVTKAQRGHNNNIMPHDGFTDDDGLEKGALLSNLYFFW